MKKIKYIFFSIGFFGTLFLTTMLFGVGNIWIDPLCFQKNLCEGFYNFLNQASFLFFVFPAVFLGSLVTYKMKDEVFLSWFRFTRWWIPLSVFLTLITPDGGGNGFGISFGAMYETVAILCSFLYAFISVVLIFVKYVTFYTPPQKTLSEKIKGKTK